MKSVLIKDTTKSERIQIIKEWVPIDEADECGIDMWKMYDPYIQGEKEISECNAAFQAAYYEVEDLQEAPGCGMGTRNR